METIIREYKVYRYDELSDEAKEKVREWYINDEFRTEIFSEDVNYWLAENFKNSELKVQYSLSYSQGDGLNIYGKIVLSDMLDKIDWSDFTEKEQRFIRWAVKEYYPRTEIPANHRYCYCIVNNCSFTENLIWDMEYDRIRDINYAALEKFDNTCIDYFENLCSEYEEAGYKYFYEPDEWEIRDCCEANDYRFTEEGKFFF